MEESRLIDIDPLESSDYPVDLYAFSKVVSALDGFPDKASSVIDQLDALGFVTIDNALDDTVVQGVLNALFRLTTIPLPERTQLQFEHVDRELIESASAEERLDYIRKLMWFVDLDPRISALAHEPRILELVSRALHAEPEMFQEMALLKPPGIGREKPWHQDHAYFNLPEGTKVVGVWIALDDATPENGCMHFMPGGHREGPIPHFNRRDWQICDRDILDGKTIVAAPLRRGGFVIFDGLVPHGTPQNRTNTRRRALQFHYVAKGTPRISTDERLALFGPEGGDASC